MDLDYSSFDCFLIGSICYLDLRPFSSRKRNLFEINPALYLKFGHFNWILARFMPSRALEKKLAGFRENQAQGSLSHRFSYCDARIGPWNTGSSLGPFQLFLYRNIVFLYHLSGKPKPLFNLFLPFPRKKFRKNQLPAGFKLGLSELKARTPTSMPPPRPIITMFVARTELF